ncbi:hypothetical protein CDAR_71021 [Caerostris darwini]|uniref:C2H2-type domain-containing protein n=1 Tax=Caerostris darwini TaxID=1538125 RepID=A0AAV4WHC5_9ARAC|nr:hypothetical protein CDAR_71021 [Caerostris darwini]
MVLNVIEWLKAKLCGCCASLESEEQFQSRLFVCQGCGHISLSEKGLRLHSLLVHKEGRLFERTLDANGRPLNYFGELPVLPPKPPSKQLRIKNWDEEERKCPTVVI